MNSQLLGARQWKPVQPPRSRAWQFLINLIVLLPYDLTVLLWKNKNLNLQTHINLMNVCSNFICDNKKLEIAQMPFNRWIAINRKRLLRHATKTLLCLVRKVYLKKLHKLLNDSIYMRSWKSKTIQMEKSSRRHRLEWGGFESSEFFKVMNCFISCLCWCMLKLTELYRNKVKFTLCKFEK